MTSQPEFTALTRPGRLSTLAADQIAQMILDHALPDGAKLPSERRLAESLGVSRTVIREAIRLLEARKLVEVQTGRGAVVRGYSSESVSESISMLLDSASGDLSFEDVLAVRDALEVTTAGLAAEQATDEDLETMHDALDRMINAGTVQEQVEADYDFHLAIAEATHNKLFVLLLQALNAVLVEIWHDYWTSHASLNPTDYLAADSAQSESNLYHCQILDMIQAHNPSEARRWMARMLEHWGDMYAGTPP